MVNYHKLNWVLVQILCLVLSNILLITFELEIFLSRAFVLYLLYQINKNMLSEKQKELNEFSTTAQTEYNRITKEVLPMDISWGCKVLTHPMPTIDQAKNAVIELEKLKASISVAKQQYTTFRDNLINEKIEELGKIIGTKDYSKKTPKQAKWVSEVMLQSRIERNMTLNSLLASIPNTVQSIQKWIIEQSTKTRERDIQNQKSEQVIWCKKYLNEKMHMSESLLSNLSQDTIIDISHTHIKTEYAKQNGITGEKCYCEEHGENRHYHFVETDWNGKEVTAYETSETY
jgi:hypothetical protein